MHSCYPIALPSSSLFRQLLEHEEKVTGKTTLSVADYQKTFS